MSDRKYKYMVIHSRFDDNKFEVWEFIDNLEEACSYWYVRDAIKKYGVDSVMPIVMNPMGGYHTHPTTMNDVVCIIESWKWPKVHYTSSGGPYLTFWPDKNGEAFDDFEILRNCTENS